MRLNGVLRHSEGAATQLSVGQAEDLRAATRCPGGSPSLVSSHVPEFGKRVAARAPFLECSRGNRRLGEQSTDGSDLCLLYRCPLAITRV
ncbi:hypothetical protein AURDEDRAFT_116258, partial [Auricularia subglabra TFB-10046 SS5]